jgi:hypothetical protein
MREPSDHRGASGASYHLRPYQYRSTHDPCTTHRRDGSCRWMCPRSQGRSRVPHSSLASPNVAPESSRRHQHQSQTLATASDTVCQKRNTAHDPPPHAEQIATHPLATSKRPAPLDASRARCQQILDSARPQSDKDLPLLIAYREALSRYPASRFRAQHFPLLVKQNPVAPQPMPPSWLGF